MADELDDIIISMNQDPALMGKEELEDDAENIVMAMSQAFQQAGYDVPAQELFDILNQVGFDTPALIKELNRRQQ